MAKIVEAFQPQKIEIIKRMLEKQSAKGAAMAYEIYVDNFKVVMKTTDLAEFDSYEDLMSDDTRLIRINVFHPTDEVGPTKYVFELEEKRKPILEKPLGEVTDISSKIRESIEVERERWDKEQLTKELGTVKRELHEAEEYIEELQSQLEKSKVKPNHWGKIDLGLLAGVALEGVMRKNPKWIAKVPALEGLAGVIAEENNSEGRRIEAPSEESEVSFSKKSDSPTLSEEEQTYVHYGRRLSETFNDSELFLLDKIIWQLGKETGKLKIVADLLNIPLT